MVIRYDMYDGDERLFHSSASFLVVLGWGDWEIVLFCCLLDAFHACALVSM